MIANVARDIDEAIFTLDVLRPLRELNLLFLDLMTDCARDTNSHTKPTLVTELSQDLQRLTSAAVNRLAACSIALVDLGFDRRSWNSTPIVSNGLERAAAPPGVFDRIAAVGVANATVTLAWTLARWHTEVARIVFGMSESAIREVSALGGPHTIHQWSQANPHRVRPRWERQPRIWWKLLRIAQEEPQGRLPPLSMYALQRQLADLVSMESATSESG
jgi:hypothetical protein